MADTDFTTVTDGDTTAADVIDAGASKTDQAKQTVKDYSSKYGAQATDKIRTLADTGKERAVGGLDQLSTLINDAAQQVDDKLGAQYGDYARTGVAVGVAAALGFAVARLVQSGIDGNKA
jgi:hypothetical protein